MRTFQIEADAQRAEMQDLLEPFAVASRIQALSRDWVILSFDYSWDRPYDGGPRQARWSIRRIYGDARGRQGLDWAWSPDCPAVEQVVTDMEQIEAPVLDVPGAGWESSSDVIIVTADGAGYRLSTTAVRSRDAEPDAGLSLAWHDLDMSSNVGTPLANWFDAAMTALEPCWTRAAPDLD